jgi:hypothetical protein
MLQVHCSCENAAEMRARLCTMTAFISVSIAAATGSDPATNGAVGGAIASNTAYMRAILARGGSNGLNELYEYSLMPALRDFGIMSYPIETPVVPQLLRQIEFQQNCKLIIENLFKDHANRRYMQASAHKFKTIKISPRYVAPIASTQLIKFIGWNCFGAIVISLTFFGALYLFQLAESKRYHQNDEILIDVTDY